MFSKAKSKNKKQDVTSELVEIGDAPERAPSRTAPSRQQKTSARMSGANGRKPAARSSGVPSLISGDVIIKGMIEAESEVQFDGFLEGDIRAKGLVIGEGASVRGEVVASRVKVAGTVDGSIRASHVELASSSNVKGDILHSALSIENGARFDGNCRHSDDPTTETVSRSSAPSPKIAQPKTTATAAAEPVESNDKVEAEKSEPEAKGSSFLSRGAKSELR